MILLVHWTCSSFHAGKSATKVSLKIHDTYDSSRLHNLHQPPSRVLSLSRETHELHIILNSSDNLSIMAAAERDPCSQVNTCTSNFWLCTSSYSLSEGAIILWNLLFRQTNMTSCSQGLLSIVMRLDKTPLSVSGWCPNIPCSPALTMPIPGRNRTVKACSSCLEHRRCGA